MASGQQPPMDWSDYLAFSSGETGGNWGYMANGSDMTSDALFSQFTNAGDSPLPTDAIRNDSTATMYRRDTVVGQQGFATTAQSQHNSLNQASTSDARSSQLQQDVPEALVQDDNLISPVYETGLTMDAATMQFDSVLTGIAPQPHEESELPFGSAEEFGTNSAIWNPTSTPTPAMESGVNASDLVNDNTFDSLIATPQESMFQTTSDASNFNFNGAVTSPLTISTPADNQNSVFSFQSGTNSPTEFLTSQQHSPNTAFNTDIPAFPRRSVSGGVDASRSPESEPIDDALNSLPSGLRVELQDNKRRVETQVGVTLTITNVPDGAIKVHLQPETIPKLKKISKVREQHTDTLELHTSVVCDSAMRSKGKLERAKRRAAGLFVQSPAQPYTEGDIDNDPDLPLNGGEVKICANCIDRERKRAGRQKVKKAEEDEHFDEYAEKRIIVFNPKEGDTLLMHPPSTHSEVPKLPTTKQVVIPMRICCYCRHHNETEGFQVIFTLKDHLDNVIAQGVSTTLMITDDHKTPEEKKSSATLTKGNTSPEIPQYGAQSQPGHHNSKPSSTTSTPPLVSHPSSSSLPQTAFAPSLSSSNLHQQAFAAASHPLYTPSTTPKLQTTFPMEVRHPSFGMQQAAYQPMSAGTFSNGFGRGSHRPWASTSNLQALGGAGDVNGFASLYEAQAPYLQQSQSTSVTPRNLSRPASPTFGQSTMKRRKNRPDLSMTPAGMPMQAIGPHSPQAVSPPVGMLVHHMYTALHLVDPSSPSGYAQQGQIIDPRNLPPQYNPQAQYVTQDGQQMYMPAGDVVDYAPMQFNGQG